MLEFVFKDMFVLLDLIGHKNVQFQNFFDRTTGRYYNRLRDIGKFDLFFSVFLSL